MCWYDYQSGRDDNTRRADADGDTQMPPGQDPWTLDDQAWAQITTGQLSSACTGITAAVETVSHNGVDETAANLTATRARRGPPGNCPGGRLRHPETSSR